MDQNYGVVISPKLFGNMSNLTIGDLISLVDIVNKGYLVDEVSHEYYHYNVTILAWYQSWQLLHIEFIRDIFHTFAIHQVLGDDACVLDKVKYVNDLLV